MMTHQNPLISFAWSPRIYAVVLLFACMFVSVTSLTAQRVLPQGATARATPDCPDNDCPCDGGFIEMQVYYFGDDNVTVEVFREAGETTLITTFLNVMSGDLLTVNGAALPNGQLGPYTYFRITNGLDVCTTRIWSRCPAQAWPGSGDDTAVLGTTVGDFTVFSYTDSDNTVFCDVSNIEQDWHVGGNIISPANNTLGTRNNESVVFITDDTPRGTILNTGEFGINTTAPGAQLDVQGDAIVDETLDVNGIARMNALDGSTNPTDGALIVAGGAGIGENINVGNNADIGNDLDVTNDARVGNDLDVNNNATVGNDLSVGRDASVGRNLDVTEDAVIGIDATVGNNASVGNNLDVTNNAVVGNDLSVGRDASVGRDLDVTDNAVIGVDATVGNSASVGNDLDVGDDATVGGDLDVMSDAHVDGVVTIGTNNTPPLLGTINTSFYHLFVQGGILADEVLVRTGWADYVFEENYELRTLEEVEQFIQEEGHLPNTPSAQEIEDGGLQLGTATVNQQEKIEELFLYLIEMDKEMEDLKAENAALRARLDQLERQ